MPSIHFGARVGSTFSWSTFTEDLYQNAPIFFGSYSYPDSGASTFVDNGEEVIEVFQVATDCISYAITAAVTYSKNVPINTLGAIYESHGSFVVVSAGGCGIVYDYGGPNSETLESVVASASFSMTEDVDEDTQSASTTGEYVVGPTSS